MIVGIPTETFPGERRVAMVPAGATSLCRLDCEVHVQAGAGLEAGFIDQMYEDAGAKMFSERKVIFEQADVIVSVRSAGGNPEAGRSDLEMMKDGQLVVGFLEPLSDVENMKALASTQATSCAMELIPRTSRAQSMDALSSQANIGGYKAAILASETLPRMVPMMMTAAGTIAPAHVFVVGAGVAGLQAIATCKRLGAVIQAYDIRATVKDQVQSVGGQFVEMELKTHIAETPGGYAQAMDEAFYEKQRQLMMSVVADNDVVITTAAIPGKKAPILVTEEMIEGMKPGSVVVDLAAERGGNCDLTEPGKTVVKHGVTILGPTNLPSTVPYHSSQMYSNNIVNFLKLMIEGGSLNTEVDDDIVKAAMVTRGGEIINARVQEILAPG
ncbi:MAG: Re/Si-specific NAD(P)(+) transhydrogenase subunit alpha [Gemmatimonadota bacterium]|nr:Re/Si-specific NAD(P)(+) transhydrogenase subunit alpha [Gemmatimonadota bacterium]